MLDRISFLPLRTAQEVSSQEVSIPRVIIILDYHYLQRALPRQRSLAPARQALLNSRGCAERRAARPSRRALSDPLQILNIFNSSLIILQTLYEKRIKDVQNLQRV